MQQRELKFNIVTAAGMAFYYLQNNLKRVFKLGLVLIVATFVTEAFLHYGLQSTEGLLNNTLRLPELVAEAWVVFVIARHVIFDENVYHLSDDKEAQEDRRRLLQISVLISVLIELISVALFLGLLAWQKSDIEQLRMTFDVMSVVALVAFVWALRLKALPVVAASGMSIRQFLTDVKGMMFSLRLLGLFLLCILPIWFLSQILLLPILDSVDPETGTMVLTDVERIYFFLVTSVLSLLKAVVMTVAIVSALKEMYGSKPISV